MIIVRFLEHHTSSLNPRLVLDTYNNISWIVASAAAAGGLKQPADTTVTQQINTYKTAPFFNGMYLVLLFHFECRNISSNYNRCNVIAAA